MKPPSRQIEQFRQTVLEEGSLHWRELPWRNIDDAYAVLVSEIMLQQTQVKRVLGYWERFMGLFPTLDALASADTALVLEMWQGLGYNRRALALKRCAEVCSQSHGGELPRDRESLLALPGVGPATAGGVLAFAYNTPCVYLETNVRSVFLHHFFPDAQKVPDRVLEPLVLECCPEEKVRAWYYALLDYGADLKSRIPNPSRRSAAYTKQSPFEGSRRQKRSFLLRSVLGSAGVGFAELYEQIRAAEEQAGRVAPSEADVQDLLDELVDEGFFHCETGMYRA